MTGPPAWESLGPEAKRELLAQLLREKAEGARVFALSRGQEALWFLHQMAPESFAYNVAFTAIVHSPLDVAALERAFARVVGRHEMLRTTFESLGKAPVQRVHDTVPVRFEEVDGRGWSREQVVGALSRIHERPFDLSKGPVFRLAVVQNAEGGSAVLFTVHHIAFDGWSMGLLLDEWFSNYAAETTGVAAVPAPLPLRYADYVRWHEDLLRGPQGAAMWAYWERQLAGLPVSLDLPLDHLRPAVQSFSGATHEFRIEPALAAALRDLARQRGATLFMVLLAAFQALLRRYTGQDDLVVGSPTAGRSRMEFEGLIGYFVNPVVLRGDLSGDPPFLECIDRARTVVVDALRNADFPFPLLVERLHPPRDASRSPLFQVDFNLVKTDQVGVASLGGGGALSRSLMGGLEVTPFALRQQEGQFDLTLEAFDTGGLILSTLKYATDLFEPKTIERMAGHLKRLLEGIVASPGSRISDLPLLTPAEEEQLTGWNANAQSYPGQCVHELIVEAARRDPDRIAAECGSARLTARELEDRSGRLAGHLRGLGVGPDVLVGIFMERSLDMLVGVLGILRAGGAYVPLDPAYPADRLSYMIEASGARVVVTQRVLSESLPTGGLTAVCVDDDADWGSVPPRPAVPSDPGDVAYVIFTSGSTGQPKGVAVTHRSLVNLLTSMAGQPGLTPRDTLLSVTTLSFDIGTLELFLPLLVGARLVLVERDDAADGRAIADHLTKSGATVMQATPATWRLLLEAGWSGTPGLKILCGGEALPRDLANELLRRAAEVWNVYGPTETTIYSSGWRVTGSDGPVPIGGPIANTTLHVLDHHSNRVPIGVSGELFIGGDGLARGYWGRPDLTAERFVPDPFAKEPGARLYRTGDVARRLADGSIECLGRLDHQVKVRGFRIELGEIEASLRRHPGIEGAVVLAQDVAGGDRRLVAYLAHGSSGQPNVTGLRTHLKASLPAYMIPSSFVFLDRLPLTPNGKLDRKALAALESGHTSAAKAYVAPRTPTEAFIAELWQELLGLERVGVRDNFFDLGGHSLLAMRVLAAIEKRTGHRFHPRDVIFQTLEQLAAACHVESAPAPNPPSGDGLGRKMVRALQALVGGRETTTPDE